MVDSVQPIMILGTREAQIMLIPDHIDLCADRLSHITNLKDEQSLPLKYDIPFHGNIKMIISIVSSNEFSNDNIE
jgi:hypothetical protein